MNMLLIACMNLHTYEQQTTQVSIAKHIRPAPDRHYLGRDPPQGGSVVAFSSSIPPAARNSLIYSSRISLHAASCISYSYCASTSVDSRVGLGIGDEVNAAVIRSKRRHSAQLVRAHAPHQHEAVVH